MGKNAFIIRRIRYNFVKMWIACSEASTGGCTPRICATLSSDGPPTVARFERHGFNGPCSIPYLKGGKDLRLGAQDALGFGSLVPATRRATLLPAAALCHHVDNLHRSYSSVAPEMRVDGGVVQIELAQTGEGIADCELLKWFVQEGDEVDEFQPLCEVQSDKASVEITSRYKGKVTKVNFIPGDIVKVGEALLEVIIESNDGPTSDSPSDQKEHRGISSNVPTDSSRIDTTGKGIQTTPAVRHLAKAYGVNLADVPASGDNGRILKEDLLKFVMSKEELNEEIRAIEPDSSISDREVDDPISAGPNLFSKDRVGEVSVAMKPAIEDVLRRDIIIPVRGFRRIMVKTMTAAVAVPHFYYTEDIKVDGLVQLKDNLKGLTLERGVKLTYLPFLLKALSLALKDYPLMNSSVNEDISEITQRASHNIGVGIATNEGLVVPNIKNVQNLSVLEIAEELYRLSQLAATNKLCHEDVTGGTITMSNFGAIGGKYGSPVLNLPEVAIVAIGRIQKVPHYAQDGSIYPASIMGVTWGADHRVVDGATVARFCNKWKQLIEQPAQFLLNMR
ncbi:unnamed protein product [Calypogeia fissa]